MDRWLAFLGRHICVLALSFSVILAPVLMLMTPMMVLLAGAWLYVLLSEIKRVGKK